MSFSFICVFYDLIQSCFIVLLNKLSSGFVSLANISPKRFVIFGAVLSGIIFLIFPFPLFIVHTQKCNWILCTEFVSYKFSKFICFNYVCVLCCVCVLYVCVF